MFVIIDDVEYLNASRAECSWNFNVSYASPNIFPDSQTVDSPKRISPIQADVVWDASGINWRSTLFRCRTQWRRFPRLIFLVWITFRVSVLVLWTSCPSSRYFPWQVPVTGWRSLQQSKWWTHEILSQLPENCLCLTFELWPVRNFTTWLSDLIASGLMQAS